MSDFTDLSLQFVKLEPCYYNFTALRNMALLTPLMSFLKFMDQNTLGLLLPLIPSLLPLSLSPWQIPSPHPPAPVGHESGDTRDRRRSRWLRLARMVGSRRWRPQDGLSAAPATLLQSPCHRPCYPNYCAPATTVLPHRPCCRCRNSRQGGRGQPASAPIAGEGGWPVPELEAGGTSLDPLSFAPHP